MVHDLISELWNYICNLTIFLASAIILFYYFHKLAGKDCKDVRPTSEAILTTEKTPDSRDLTSIAVDNNISILSNVSGDESFLMVSSLSLEMDADDDVRLNTNFDRLKAQSWRTIQTLTQNRRRLILKTAQGSERTE
ncbi:hypothetical protein M413DRAFT_298443 [Hebeloma cylindrosporum]|uniref:Uncharacterized protein n=1 Tax=Hebeloma cylindrosporum TaxID=76867 RepID=A0A0C3CAW0_HEBCY|nr:hypothetical protein M413DRAFT_298443 [Hebeloma cylindrosporum h7]